MFKSGKSFYFYIVRSSLVFIWLAIIAFFLYVPYLNFFYASRQTLNIYTWADMLNTNDLKDFYKQTGIKVNLIYYDNCEELYAKLQINQGLGCDLLILGDSIIPDLIKLQLLLPIDRTKLNFWHNLQPQLLNQNYDRGNLYTIPYSWDVYGLGINQVKLAKDLLASWQLIFDPSLNITNIGMVEEGLRAVSIAKQYLYGHVTSLDDSQIEQIKNLLIKQKKQVEVYTELLGGFLLHTKTCPLVVSQSAYISKVMAQEQAIKFVMPQEGGFISTENFAISKKSVNHDQVYLFINFIYQKKLMHDLFARTGFLPARRDVLQEIDLSYLNLPTGLDDQFFAKIDYFSYVLSREEVGRLWIEVKAS